MRIARSASSAGNSDGVDLDCVAVDGGGPGDLSGLGTPTAPVHIARGLTPAQARPFELMDNRASENAEWDEALPGLRGP